MPNIALNDRAIDKLATLLIPVRGIVPLLRQDGLTRVPGLSAVNLDSRILAKITKLQKRDQTFSDVILRELP